MTGSPSPLHADALRLLSAWTAPAPAQERVRRDYVRHLHDQAGRPGAGVFQKTYPDHLTASTLVVSADHNQVLLTLHAKARMWFQLGGHCEEGDDTLAGAALREAQEESGVDALRLDPVPVQLSPHAVPFCDPRGGVRHLDVRFVALAPADAAHRVSEESLEVAWWPADDLPTEDRDLVALVALARRRLEGDQSRISSAAAIAAAPSSEQSGGSAVMPS